MEKPNTRGEVLPFKFCPLSYGHINTIEDIGAKEVQMRPELLEDSHICLQEEEEWENR